MHDYLPNTHSEVKERETMSTVTEIPSLGYGNPDSKISYAKQLESGELTEAVAARAVELIASGEMMKAIDNDDDGCIDGRPTTELLYINETGEFYTKQVESNEGHERAKVAGGGYMTSLAMQRALEEPSVTLDEDLANVANTLSTQEIYCGAHSGEHGHAEVTDCGANDKFQPIIENGIVFREPITGHVKALLEVAGVDFDQAIMDDVFAGWSKTLDRNEYFEGSTGKSRFGVIEQSMRDAQERTGSYEKPIAVSKHLAGDHKEDFIIINFVEGKTFSQVAFAKQLVEDFPEIPAEKRAQAFVVDVPRIVTLAGAIAATSGNDNDSSPLDYSEREIAQRTAKALYAGVAYQLATAATLTDGSLRNFIVS